MQSVGGHAPRFTGQEDEAEVASTQDVEKLDGRGLQNEHDHHLGVLVPATQIWVHVQSCTSRTRAGGEGRPVGGGGGGLRHSQLNTSQNQLQLQLRITNTVQR